MPLRQIARTPSRPLPPRDGHGIPYAFAVDIVQANDGGRTIIYVRCPWCGDTESEAGVMPTCPRIGRRYTVAIPAGTPVLA